MYQDIFDLQFNHSRTNKSNYEERILLLKRLKNVIKENEQGFLVALNLDLNKSEFEAYVTELAIIYKEIDYHIKHLKKWMQFKTVKTPIIFFKAQSKYRFEPLGTTLIIGPFNYPLQLVILPLIGAISAGNTIILKPSEHTVNTSKLIREIINTNFKKEIMFVVDFENGVETTNALLDLNFDMIFFTGSTKVGKIVMNKASQHLSKVVLELGGKSPCIVNKDADIDAAARKIVWGKTLNAGQTCIAPDYIIVHEAVKEALILKMAEYFESFYPNYDEYVSIINKASYNRLVDLVKEHKILYQGKRDQESKHIGLVLVDEPCVNSKLMEEEIFGPILPILMFNDLNMVIKDLQQKDIPLALYYFGSNKVDIENVIDNTKAGGVTINDTLLHVSNDKLPFGGQKTSGLGNYHGYYSYLAFSVPKPVVIKSKYFDLSLKYPPYKNKISAIRKYYK